MNILSVMPFEQRHRDLLERTGTGCSFIWASIPTVTMEQVEQADIILGNVPPAMLKNAGRLQWLQLNSAGADAYCAPGILPQEVLLTCSTGAYGISVSEWMVTASLMLCRKMDLYMRNQLSHRWHDEGRVTSVWNSTTLVVGLGDIGGEYAKRMKALGSYVIGVRRRPSDTLPDYLDELHTTEELDMLLPRADFVALILPGTPQTDRLMNAQRLALMKPGAFLLNAGRGNSVDAEALVRALESGALGGAALDVVPGPEPLDSSSPLWDAPRCMICPHIAGKFNLPETFERITAITDHNLRAYLQGNRGGMRNIVDRSTGYRTR